MSKVSFVYTSSLSIYILRTEELGDKNVMVYQLKERDAYTFTITSVCTVIKKTKKRWRNMVEGDQTYDQTDDNLPMQIKSILGTAILKVLGWVLV